MNTLPGGFEAFYGSVWQHPWLLWAVALLACAYAYKRHPAGSDARRYATALTVLSLCDAWLTANHVFGIGSWCGGAASLVPLFFVLAGDFRFLLLLGAAKPSGAIRPDAPSIAIGLALTAIVPLSSQFLVGAIPGASEEPRVLFFIYEVLFVALALALRRFHPTARTLRWVRSLCGFVAVYYSLWATADAVLLLTGWDLGFGLRVVPNALYYGGFIAAIARFAPTLRDEGSGQAPPAYGEPSCATIGATPGRASTRSTSAANRG